MACLNGVTPSSPSEIYRYFPKCRLVFSGSLHLYSHVRHAVIWIIITLLTILV